MLKDIVFQSLLNNQENKTVGLKIQFYYALPTLYIDLNLMKITGVCYNKFIMRSTYKLKKNTQLLRNLKLVI